MHFWTPRHTTYLVLEVLREKTKGRLVRVGEDGAVCFGRAWDDFPWSRMKARTAPFTMRYPVVVAADSVLAYTATVPVHLERERSGEPVEETELENFLAREIARILTRIRGEASRELGVGELDAVLVGSRVKGSRADGHRVIDAVGFRAKHIEVILELTLTTREVFEKLNLLAVQGRRFWFRETGEAITDVLYRFRRAPCAFARLRREEAVCFVADRTAVGCTIRRVRLQWRTASLFETLRAAWGLGKSADEALYRVWRRGETSPAVARAVKRLLVPLVGSLVAELRRLRIKSPLYVESDLDLPFPLPSRQQGILFEQLPLSLFTESDKFRYEGGSHEDPGEIFRTLAPLVHVYYDKSEESVLNRRLRRRLHWLEPNT